MKTAERQHHLKHQFEFINYLERRYKAIHTYEDVYVVRGAQT